MTWTVKQRPHIPGTMIVADYECPDHGRFEVTVERNLAGDPPEAVACIVCGEPSAWRISAAGALRVQLGAVSQGKVMTYDKPEHMLDTRPLADGMPYDEWKRGQLDITRDINLKRHRAARSR